MPGGKSQAGAAVVEQRLSTRAAQVEERRTGGGAEEWPRTGGGEQRSGRAHAEEQSGGVQVEESRVATTRRWKSRGAAARPRESEDCQRGWLPIRASLGVIMFRWASGLPLLMGRVGCYGTALPFLLTLTFMQLNLLICS
jgi:hypothetical protein